MDHDTEAMKPRRHWRAVYGAVRQPFTIIDVDTGLLSHVGSDNRRAIVAQSSQESGIGRACCLGIALRDTLWALYGVAVKVRLCLGSQ